jgi:chromosomal replication initiation ATPase DnaA
MITNFETLVRETSDAFDVPPNEILGPKRTKEASLARHVIMACWSDDHSLQDTVNRCNRRCHSTVIWARHRVFNMAELDRSFALLIDRICRRSQDGAEILDEPEPELPPEPERIIDTTKKFLTISLTD